MYTEEQKEQAKPMIDEYKALGLSDIDSIRLGIQMWEGMKQPEPCRA